MGVEVNEGDILIGKITPKGETEPSPEEKLLRAIFGDKAGDVKDASLKASPQTTGIVIEKKLFARIKKDKTSKQDDKSRIAKLQDEHDKNAKLIKASLVEKLFAVLSGKTSQGVFNVYNEELIPKGTKFTMKNLNDIDFIHINANHWTTDAEKNELD